MKKINAKTSKRIVTVVLAAIAACSVMGCSVEKNVTRTETHTVTDADGNTTTTTVTNHNGEVTTETTTMTAEEAAAAEAEDAEAVEAEEAPEFFSNVPLKIENNMGFDVAALNIKTSGDEEWSENFIPENMVIADDAVATGINLSYDEDHRFMDVYMADADGAYVEFDGIELPTDGEEITLSFVCNADGTYTVNVI